MMTDPYRALGVKSTASIDDIKSAYRKLARENHPDRRPGDKRAEDRFKDISTAYKLLSDAAKRRQYDNGEIDAQGNRRAGFGAGYEAYKRHAQAGARAQTAGAGTGGGAKKSTKNPFNSFFKDRAQKPRQSIKAKGADVSYTLSVTFLEAAQGVTKTVRMTSGKTLKVTIPSGTQNGQTLRLKGQGMEGIGGGATGDALVEILINTDDVTYRSEDLDVYSEEQVTLGEAVLGGRIEVQTIHGPVLVTVPENSNTGTKLRLKGKGIHKGSTERGDHYVSLKVVLPSGDDPELKKFVKKWSAKKPYSVRKETLNRTAAE